MPCACKCCCGCCCGEEPCSGSCGEGSPCPANCVCVEGECRSSGETTQAQCQEPNEYLGNGSSCAACCDLGQIRDDIDSEEDCPGDWVADARCAGCGCPPDRVCGEACCEEGQECVDGQCVASTACCIGGTCDPNYTTQEACEDCTVSYFCVDMLSGGYPADSCEECPPGTICQEALSGPCGKWLEGGSCQAQSDCSPETNPAFLCVTFDPPEFGFALPAVGGCAAEQKTVGLPADAAAQLWYSVPPGWRYTLFLGGSGSIDFLPSCGHWFASGVIAIGSPFFGSGGQVEFEFDDCGPVTDGQCDPANGLSCSGTAYWRYFDCRDGAGVAQRDVSGSFGVTVSIGPCPPENPLP